MDVTCERCKAEYEFDDSLLGEKGTTVKCSSCQHVFRVAPPRKDARPMMKLRFRANGIVAPIASLRELQQRIQAGQIGPDDELGRDGSPWRKLQDVPELRGFFAAIADEQPTATRARPAGLAVSQDSVPSPRTSAQPGKRTMVGVGPSQAPNIPPSPRVPAVVSSGLDSKGPGLAAPVRAPMADARPVPTDAMATTHTASSPGKTLPPMAALPPAGVMANAAAQSATPSVPPAARSVGSSQVAATKPESMPVSPSLPPVSPKTSLAPSAGTSAEKAAVPVGSSGAPRLFLADDEAPPARATEGSKSWLYIGAAGLLAIGGWLGVSAISSKPEAPATPAPRVEAPVQAAPASPEATPEATPQVPAPGTSAATTPTPDPKVAAPSPGGETAASAGEAKPSTPAGSAEAENAPDKTVKAAPDGPAPEEAPAGDAERSEGADKAPRSGGSSANSEPTDYTGWVTRGAKLAKQGKHDEARAAFTKALELRASGSEANAGLGAVLVASDQAQAAIEPLEKAARAGYAEANVTLGDAYRKLGRKEDALESYNTYVARFPNGSRAAYAKLQASALGGDKKEGPAAEEPAGSPVEYKPAGEPPTPAEPTQ